MAEVLPPLTQSSAMLHPRPSSADAFQTQPQRLTQGQAPRNMYSAQNGSYRGASAAPVQPYAFQATPHLRQESRTSSAAPVAQNGHRQPGHVPSASTSSSDTSSGPSAKDDSVMGSRPGSFINLSAQLPDLSFTPFESPIKSSPDRYRRPAQKRVDSNVSLKAAQTGSAAPSGSGMGAVSHLYQPPAAVRRQESATDDTAMSKTKESELAKRYRRRSLNALETQNIAGSQAAAGTQRPASGHGASATSTPTTIRPVSFQSQTSSDDGKSRQNSASQTSLHKIEPAKENVRPQDTPTSSTAQKAVTVPPRGSSDANKRLAGPSPLSKPPVDEQHSPAKPRTYASVAQAAVAGPSPTPGSSTAAAQLAALSDKDLNKGMKSRLRRAFSFGSAQELRRAAGENHHVAQAQAALQAKEQHQQKMNNELELDAEQQEIARRQEAAGIGAGIYSGQGGFSGSTDN
ncbi:bud neck involved protein, partial [Teratosphaeriaceae sp. CCFEE 6253]